MENKKNIIIINSNLEKYLDKFEKNNEVFNYFFSAAVEDLDKNLKLIKNKDRSSNLVVIEKTVFNDSEIKKQIKNIFLNNFNFSNPHFLLLSDDFASFDELEKIFNEQNFFYLTKNFDIATFNINLILILQHTEDLKRLDNYIIQSFQTIVNSELITEQKFKIENLYKQLEVISKIDMLTSVLNRRAFFDAMEVEKSRALRDLWRIQNADLKNKSFNDGSMNQMNRKFSYKPSGGYNEHFGKFACLMIDIDNFKSINDKYGHLSGDEVLRRFGLLLSLKTNFRDIDIIGRYGGEEFIILLPETSSKDALKPAKRLSKSLREINFNFENEIVNVTISIGISEFRMIDTCSDDIISRADKALYYAKNSGRDKIVIYEDIFQE